MGKRQIIIGWLALTLSAFSTVMAANIEISAKARKKGMEKAPALIQASSINCTLSDARLIEFGSRTSSFAGSTTSMSSGGGSDSGGGPPSGGGGEDSGRDGGGIPAPSSSATQYEVACNEGLGYVITTLRGKTPEATLCLEMEDLSGTASSGSPPNGPTSGMSAAPSGGMGAGGAPQGNQSKCLLPGNANQVAGLTAFIIKAGLQCLPIKARGMGHTAKNTFFEVACDDNTGYVIATSPSPDSNKEVQASDCASLPANSNIRCTLTDPKAALMVADQLMAKSEVPCKVTDRRMFGNNAAGDKFYEVACAEGSGYVVQQTFSGEFGQAITCADIGTMAGGCQLAGNQK